MATELRIQFLGDFRVSRGGDIVRTLGSPRLQALLAHLVLHRAAPRSRRHLAFQFWPDSTESQAQTNLRQLLHRLRRCLPDLDDCMIVDRNAISWEPPDWVTVDVVALEAAWAEAEEASSKGRMARAIAAAENAVSLYTGELLPACYDAWIEPHRSRITRTTLAGTARLVGWLEERREWSSALVHAQRLVEWNPAREQPHRAVIRLHALLGDVALASEAYAAYAEFLETEIGAEPSEEIRALVQRVQTQTESVALHKGERSGLVPDATPLVGRHDEWRRLEATWRQVESGLTQVLLIRGEAGVGKTRLATDFQEWAARQGAATAYARCWAVEGSLPFSPVAEWLRTDPLHATTHSLDPVWRSEVARVLPELGPNNPRTSVTSAAEGRLRLFEGLAHAVASLDQPLLLVLDDLHWCERDTLEWLHFLLRFRRGMRLLLLLTIRSGEPVTDARLHSWLPELRRLCGLTEVHLGPLEADATAALGAAVAGQPLEKWESDALFAETEGNPLFVVELVRRRRREFDELEEMEERRGPPWGAALPTKVHDVIRGRLELLSAEAADLIALLATIGKDFSFDVIREAHSGDVSRVIRALEELIERRLIREVEGEVYDFSHDKVREVAYSGLSQARRRILHERVATALEATLAITGDRVYGEVADHLDRAGLHEAAISWYRLAAEHALTLYANQEAIDHLERAVELLRKQPESDAHAEMEIELQTALGVPLVLTDHYAGTRVWKAYSRARELSERLGRPVAPPVLRALALLSLTRSRLPEVLRLADELMRIARGDSDPMMHVEAHYVMGVALYWQGRIPDAARHLARALDFYQPERARDHLHLFTQDPGAVCGVRLALAEWHLGKADSAHRRCLNAIDRAEELGHLFSLGYARAFGTWVFVECGDLESARRQVVALRREEDPGLRVWSTMAGIVEGFLVAEAGNPNAGVQRIEAACSEYLSTGNSLGAPYHQGLLARTYRLAGRMEDALAAVDDGLAMARRTGERFWDSELHRLKGELAQKLSAPTTKVRASYRRARDIAVQQGATVLVQRADGVSIEQH